MYEFYEKNSSLCKAMDKPFEKLATQYKGRADFCKLDVDNFEVHANASSTAIDCNPCTYVISGRICDVQLLARICGVEGAYPTFVLFKKCAQVGKVVGLKEDDLERSVQRAIIS